MRADVRESRRAVWSRQLEGQDRDGRPSLVTQPTGLHRVGRLTHDLEIGLILEDGGEPGPVDQLVVREENSDRACGPKGDGPSSRRLGLGPERGMLASGLLLAGL